MTIGFIGLGLIGGSIAKAVREKYPDTIIVAFDQNTASIRDAAREGVVDVALTKATSGFSDCDLIFLCLPVIRSLEYLNVIRPQLKEGAVLTDVGSTKTAIHEAVRKLGLSGCFIGGHPMTGSEKSGYSASSSLLLENVYYMLTPEEDFPEEKTEAFRRFIQSLGSLPLILTCEQHDKVVAAVSHLPHIISASLVNLVREVDDDRQIMKTVAAGGFKDITRISSSSPEMWQEICMANSEDIAALLDLYINELSRCRDLVRAKDADGILEVFKSCKAYRDSFGSQSRCEYLLYCDIADEEGAIARIAGILADYHISIKNIGIIHNREFEEGVLKISFYDKTSLSRAIRTLKGSGYVIYEN